MKTSLKLFITLVLCLTLCLAFVSCNGSNSGNGDTPTVSNGDNPTPDNTNPQYSEGLDLWKSTDGTSYMVANIGTCTDSNIIIPSSYNGFPVTSIGESAFSNSETLSSITIPESITSIAKHAFSGCTNLTVVTIPDSVETIEEYAFSGCSNLSEVTLGEALTAIDCGVFSGCTSLTEINFNAVVMEDLETNNYVFSKAGNDSKGIKVTVGKNVTKIPAYLFSPSRYSYSNIPKIISVDFEDSSVCESIGMGAFYGCNSLTSITIPDSLISIGDSAFSGCAQLKFNEYGNAYYLGNDTNPYVVIMYITDRSIASFNIHENTKVIGNEVFYECYDLESITIPDSVTGIGNGAFWHCEALTNITIPKSVKTIGLRAFLGCNELISINVEEGNDNYCSIDGNLYTKDKKALVRYAIGKTNTSFVIFNDVTSVGASAFSGCDSLTSITIPDSVTSIGASAFSGCDSLTSITIPDSVTSIGEWAFSRCTSLRSITIPDSVTSIGARAFDDCTSLQYNNYGNACYLGNASNPHMFLIKATYTTIPDCNVHENAKLIVGYAFSNCASLTRITIPNSVTSIDNYAFWGCTSLTIYCETTKSHENWGDQWSIFATSSSFNYHGYFDSFCPVVWNCYNNDIANDGYIYIMVDGIRYKISDNTGVAAVAVQPKNITIANIPESILYNDNHYDVKSIVQYAFEKCTGLISIAISDSVKSIGESAFEECTSLTNVSFGDNSQLVNIGNYAFRNCTNLTDIAIPNGVNKIGAQTFAWCESLASIVIPKSVTEIGWNALEDCEILNIIFYGGSESDWSNMTVDSSNSELKSIPIFYYSDERPTGLGNYWHYGTNGTVEIWF